MRAFVIVVTVLTIFEIGGKACALLKHETERKLSHVAIDLFLAVLLVAWGAYLLGAGR